MLAWSGARPDAERSAAERFAYPRCLSALRDERLLAEDCIRGGEDVGDLGARGVVGVDVDPADRPLGVDEDDGGHRQVLGAVGVDSVQVSAELFLRGAQFPGSGRQQDAELAGESVASVTEDRELEVIFSCAVSEPSAFCGLTAIRAMPRSVRAGYSWSW